MRVRTGGRQRDEGGVARRCDDREGQAHRQPLLRHCQQGLAEQAARAQPAGCQAGGVRQEVWCHVEAGPRRRQARHNSSNDTAAWRHADSALASTAIAATATGSHPGGRCYNAVDGCKRLGIDGTTMDKQWAGAKKAGNLVKFGGGFYAGKIPAPAKSDNGWISGAILAIYALFSS